MSKRTIRGMMSTLAVAEWPWTPRTRHILDALAQLPGSQAPELLPLSNFSQETHADHFVHSTTTLEPEGCLLEVFEAFMFLWTCFGPYDGDTTYIHLQADRLSPKKFLGDYVNTFPTRRLQFCWHLLQWQNDTESALLLKGRIEERVQAFFMRWPGRIPDFRPVWTPLCRSWLATVVRVTPFEKTTPTRPAWRT
jgi:hypothetical protein